VTLDKMKFDDPVGAVSVHGVVGLLGLLLVPLTNDGSSFTGQLIGAATIFLWVFGVSYAAFKIIGVVTPVRVSEEEEYEGSDLSECGLEAYPEFTTAR
jgi:Amt family ammonium transporter